MTKLFSYVVRYDDGTAPNPYGGVCTLTICKPAIRRSATIGDWIVGTGSKNARLKDGNIYDLSDTLVYAMKVTDKMSIKTYQAFCVQQLTTKIPNPDSADFQQWIGDCLTDVLPDDEHIIEPNIYKAWQKLGDLQAEFALLSVHFYYFGETARHLPHELRHIIKRNQGHRTIDDDKIIARFIEWIGTFERNKIYGEPQLMFELLDRMK